MTRDDIIRMAREAGLEKYHLPDSMMEYEFDRCIERFAQIVASAEREACARVCEQMPDLEHGWRATLPSDCAAAIRARSKK